MQHTIATTTAFSNGTSIRKKISKHLGTGHHIEFTAQDERRLRHAFDYMRGYAKRQHLLHLVEVKNAEITAYAQSLPKSNHALIKKLDNSKEAIRPAVLGQMTPEEMKLDTYYKMKEELVLLEEKLKRFNAQENRISLKDLEAITKKLGAVLSKRHLEHMIWEVDEDTDGAINWDEVQLAYYRNINDTSQSEPSSFFQLLEFITFDEQHKGYITEDDCMEMLFERYGSGKLEKQLHAIFGNVNSSSQGGDGCLNLSGFLDSMLKSQEGRRAYVT